MALLPGPAPSILSKRPTSALISAAAPAAPIWWFSAALGEHVWTDDALQLRKKPNSLRRGCNGRGRSQKENNSGDLQNRLAPESSEAPAMGDGKRETQLEPEGRGHERREHQG